MEQVIKNMNFRPLLERVDYERLGAPANNATINMRVWDDLKVERLRSDAVKVIVERNIVPEPKTLFSIKVVMSAEVLVNPSAYDALDDGVEFFKGTQVMQALCSHVAAVAAQITLHSPIGPMITAPVPMLPQ